MGERSGERWLSCGERERAENSSLGPTCMLLKKAAKLGKKKFLYI